LGVGYYLVLLEVTDPTHPIVLGKSEAMPGEITGIQVLGTTAYLTYQGDRGGLVILDVANQQQPVKTATIELGTAANGLAVVYGKAYIAGGDDGLQVVDVLNRDAPSLMVTKKISTSTVNRVMVQDGYVYLAAGSAGLQILDSDDLEDIAGSLPTTQAVQLDVNGNTVFVADENEGLLIVDAADKENPSKVASENAFGGIEDMKRSGNFAYVVDGDGKLCSVDITNIQNPGSPACLDADNFYSSLIVSGATIFAAAEYDGLLSIIDISETGEMQVSGSYLTPAYGQSSTISGNDLFASQDGNSFAILDISNPAETRLKNVFRTSQGIAIEDAFIVNNTAFLAILGPGLEIVDLSDPDNPQLIGEYLYSGNEFGYASKIIVSGSYAYVAAAFGSFHGVYVYNVSDLHHPRPAAAYQSAGYPNDMARKDQTLYLADGSGGLEILNIANPPGITLINKYVDMTSVEGISITGNYAYIADEFNGLAILDISNPYSLSVLGIYNTVGMANDVEVSGTHAYVTEWDQGLEVIDVADPTHPVQFGYYDTPGSANQVSVKNGQIYLSDSEGGILILTDDNLQQGELQYHVFLSFMMR
jgi:hypothetical protein